ncbi:MAG: MBL fold metallo-hydrolase [Deltaproteobacteria bacterium]|nr:MBL fold metallo-hydrolase [Deltaproteobacteria bacterium]
MKLDGGAMFGNAPKALWTRWVKPDDRNMIEIGSRALLIETKKDKILFETGAGAYLTPDMKKRFQIMENHHVLLESLAKKGLGHEDITHVILSHLHFDHAGGLLKEWEQGQKKMELLFYNAKFIVGKTNFERSRRPHMRDKASFIPGLAELLEDTNRLRLVDNKDKLVLDELEIEFIESQGHTPGMILSYIKIPDRKILFAGDIAPGHAWTNLPITMGYDRFPEGLIDEKRQVFHRVCKDDAWIFYSHDNIYAASKLLFDKGSKRFQPVCLIKDLDQV